MAFSLSEEVAAALARFRWFDVVLPAPIERGAPEFALSGAMLESGRLDYVVDGSLSRDGNHFYISVRLFDLIGGARPVWSDRFRVAVGAVHQMDELVTARIVAQIDPILLYIEGQPRRRENQGASELLLLAIRLVLSHDRKKLDEASRLISRALEIEPDNAKVAAWAAFCQTIYVGEGWIPGTKQAIGSAREYAYRAMMLDPSSAEAQGINGYVSSVLDKDFDSAIHYFDRALRLNPFSAHALGLSSLICCHIGEPRSALQRLNRYRELAPSDPNSSSFEFMFTVAHTFAGDYERAVAGGRRAVRASPEFSSGYKPLIASLGHLGRRQEAEPYVDKLLALEPNFTVEYFGRVYPFKKSSDRERYMEGLLLAGVPERGD